MSMSMRAFVSSSRWFLSWTPDLGDPLLLCGSYCEVLEEESKFHEAMLTPNKRSPSAPTNNASAWFSASAISAALENRSSRFFASARRVVDLDGVVPRNGLAPASISKSITPAAR